MVCHGHDAGSGQGAQAERQPPHVQRGKGETGEGKSDVRRADGREPRTAATYGTHRGAMFRWCWWGGTLHGHGSGATLRCTRPSGNICRNLAATEHPAASGGAPRATCHVHRATCPPAPCFSAVPLPLVTSYLPTSLIITPSCLSPTRTLPRQPPWPPLPLVLPHLVAQRILGKVRNRLV